jgi:phenylacetate-CoA ligase
MRFHSPKDSIIWLKALWNHWRHSRMTREQLEAAQLRKFRKLVSWAHVHSPYYRKIIEERKIDPHTCVPTDFPILTKSDVNEHFDEIVTDRSLSRKRIADFLAQSADPGNLLDGRYHVVHTSGTSGTLGYYVYSRESWIRGASQVVRASRLRWRRRVAFVAATRGHFAGVSLMLTGNRGTNGWFYDVRPFDVGQPLAKIVEELNRFQPHMLSGYAAILKMLGEAQERGELRIHPTELGNGGEPLLPDVKAYLEKVFGVPVLNGYASSEHLYMAMSLKGAEGMHLLEDDLIFELGDDYTAVTNLFNDTMPLIRYRMDDVLVPAGIAQGPYPYTKVRDVVGRQENALVFTNEHGREEFIHPIVVAELVVPGLNAWQIVLESRTSFRFRAKLDGSLTPDQRAVTRQRIEGTVTALLADKEMRNVRFEIEEVESLPIDPLTGKFRLVVQGGKLAKASAV